MELEVTWQRAVRIWWSYLWRNLIAIVAAMVIGAVLGFILGAVLALLGVGSEMIRIAGMLVGMIVGLAISIVPLKLILGRDYGEFRLVLLAKDTPPSPPAAPAPVAAASVTSVEPPRIG